MANIALICLAALAIFSSVHAKSNEQILKKLYEKIEEIERIENEHASVRGGAQVDPPADAPPAAKGGAPTPPPAEKQDPLPPAIPAKQDPLPPAIPAKQEPLPPVTPAKTGIRPLTAIQSKKTHPFLEFLAQTKNSGLESRSL